MLIKRQPLNAALNSSEQEISKEVHLNNVNESNNFSRHVQNEHVKFEFSCSECDLRFTDQDDLLRHSENHVLVPQTNSTQTSVISFETPILKEERRQEQIIENVVLEKTVEERDQQTPPQTREKYPCKRCSKTYNYKGGLARHVRSEHKGIQFPCPVCHKILKRRDYLLVHVKCHKLVTQDGNDVLPSTSDTLSGEPCSDGNGQKVTNLEALLRKMFEGKHQRKTVHSGNVSCRLCFKSFKNKYIFLRHVRTDHKGIQFACPVCHRNFKSRYNLSQHLKRHKDSNDPSTNGMLKEGQCPDGTGQEETNLEVISTNSSQANQSVLQSSTASVSGKKRKRQSRPANPGHFPCQLCGKVLRFKQCLNDHIRGHTGEKPYTCPVCQKRFSSNSYLRRHKKIHSDSRPYVCEVCQKTFRQSSALRMHMLIHGNDKRHECTFCHKRFLHYQYLVFHSRVHTGEMPYECDTCHRTFRLKETMLLHQKTHKGEKNEICEHCGKRYTRKAGLRQHLLRHNAEKKFLCDECGKGFVLRATLQRHMLVHTRERTHVCEVCGMGFGQSCTLRRHMLLHTGEKPHVCDICGEGFTQKTLLQGHLRRHARK